MMRIGIPRLTRVGLQLEYRVDVRRNDVDNQLWYRVPIAYEAMVSDRADAAVVALLIPAMVDGGTMTIAGSMSERLFYNLSRSYVHVLKRMISGLSVTTLLADALQDADPTGTGVATGFSGGIDSFSLLSTHLGKRVPTGFRVSHLLFNNVGSHGRGDAGNALFAQRYQRLLPAAEELGLPFIPVDSNVDEFYDELTFQQTHTPRNASVALLLQNGLRRMIYASTFPYDEINISDTYDIAYADPLSLPLLATEMLDILSGDAHLTRVEKTLRTAELSLAHRYLDVCVISGSKNCSRCWKCLRTMLTLEIAGCLEMFRDVFDIPAFMDRRSDYIVEIAGSSDPLQREVATFAAERGIRLPKFRGRAQAWSKKLRALAKHLTVSPRAARSPSESLKAGGKVPVTGHSKDEQCP